MIKPTIGRVVLFHPAGSDPAADPFPALVAKVWNDRSINVGGFNDGGTPFGATSVTLLQDDDTPPAAGPWAEWMPYQQSVAGVKPLPAAPAHVPSTQDSDTDIEKTLQRQATAPRVTPDDIERQITGEYFFTAAQGVAGVVSADMVDRFLRWPVPASCYPDGTPGKPGRTGTNLLSSVEARAMLEDVVVAPPEAAPLELLTFCVLVMRNGFTVVGKSACASRENFDADIGRRIARKDAVDQIWPLLGYELRSKLAGDVNIFETAAAARAIR